jgi:hypothetical protein
MALKLIANYSKRLGLPGYSSHQFSISVETEVSTTADIAGESSRLYATLQQSVDEEIQHTGFIPQDGYGQGNGNGHHRNGSHNGNGHHTSNGNGNGTNGNWQCSPKQKDLILKLIDDHKLDKAEIEALARERFNGKGVKQLNKLEASGLIDELFERVGEKPSRERAPRRNGSYSRGGAR